MPGTVYVPVVDLVRVLTLPTALKFAERFGGARVYVPNAGWLQPEHPIVDAIGLEAARSLAEEWQQLEIVVPRCAAELRRLRNQAVCQDKSDLSARQCALKYETTERHIFRIWAGQEDNDAQAAEGAAQPRLF
jgi:hypothetical protein